MGQLVASVIMAVFLVYAVFCYIVFIGYHVRRGEKLTYHYFFAPVWIPFIIGDMLGYLDQEADKKYPNHRTPPTED